MRNTLFVFNPDHDLALANHNLNYMPPASARQFAADLALFPAWYAGRGNLVLAPSAYNLSFLKEMRLHFPQLASLLTEAEVAVVKDTGFMPWGWDPAIYKRLIQLGVNPGVLPTETGLNTIREKSHRLQAVRLLERLQSGYTCGESFYLTELSALRAFVESRTACLLKAPLSGSGKGLNWCRGVFTPHIHDWCRNVIRRQGGVVAEPLYDKIVDFAMEFYAGADGRVCFAGYSLFRTGSTGAYEGNLLIADSEIEERLIQYIPLETIREARRALEKHLAEMLEGAYTGYFGVDMMICAGAAEGFNYRLHPCVEVNLRMNMGISARIFHDNYVAPGQRGILRVSYYPNNERLQEEHKRMTVEYPLRIDDGKIREGYMLLVPVTPRARYSVWVLIGQSL